MIKRIDHYYASVAPGGALITFSSAIDPGKCLVVLNGNGFTWASGTIQTGYYAWAVPLMGVYQDLESSSVSVGWTQTPPAGSYMSIQIIEYI